MRTCVAFANNDVITVAWSFGTRPDGCMGFAVYRIDEAGLETPLPAMAVFPGMARRRGQTTLDCPIQKFYWKDPYARLVKERTGQQVFTYKVQPLQGRPGHLVPMPGLPALLSNRVTLDPQYAEGLRAYFNRGLVSTQRISRHFRGKPSAEKLRALVKDASAPLRSALSGDMVEALTGFVDDTGADERIHAALYELGDDELIRRLEGLGGRLRIVLSNAVVRDAGTGEVRDGNDPARARLEASGAEVLYRKMPSGRIGHNKYLVRVDGSGAPRAVLLGSTNWTSTGLCTQTNNTLVVEDAGLARRYLEAWTQLAKDTRAADGSAKALQGKPLRAWCGRGKALRLAGGERLESWFSPNTPGPRRRAPGERPPPDMARLVERLQGARQAVLFLAFHPGTPSIATWAAQALRARPDLFVRGCVTNPSASEGFYYELTGLSPPPRVAGQKRRPRQDPRVIAAEALDGSVMPEGWQRELAKVGFAIVHDKIVVIDPFADDCLVVTGSHNLGHKASYDNDENLVFVEGNRALAVAYASHVLDVYDHFTWRRKVKEEGGRRPPQILKETPEAWLSQYYRADGSIKVAQLRFWLQATGG